MGLAVGVMCLAGLEAEIRWGVFLPPPPLATLVRTKGLAIGGLSVFSLDDFESELPCNGAS